MTPLNADEELLTKMRRLGEKYYGNELYGEHLQYQHELQKLLLADRKKHELQARLEEYQQGLMVGAMPEFIGRPMAEKRIAELKQELEKL